MPSATAAQLIVRVPAFFSLQPTNLTIITGSNANFSVTPTGSAPLTFRWQKGSVTLANGGRISGATNATLTISGALPADAGNYSVVITNLVGSITSSVATLTVLVPPTITSAATASGRQGAPFSYTITATGTLPITFGAQGLPAGLSLNPTNGVISGIPSVMATIVPMPASAASRIESAANGGGTKTIAVLAPVASTAAWKVSKTGTPSTSWPPLPGVTPDTSCVP